MPLYLTTLARSTEAQRARISTLMMDVHVDVTGAPRRFVNTYFSDQPDPSFGFAALPHGKVAHVNGNIRAGRDAAAQAEIVRRIASGVASTLQCPVDEVDVVLHSSPAKHTMEGGKVLPEPGSPEEAAWKERGHA